MNVRCGAASPPSLVGRNRGLAPRTESSDAATGRRGARHHPFDGWSRAGEPVLSRFQRGEGVAGGEKGYRSKAVAPPNEWLKAATSSRLRSASFSRTLWT